MLNDFWLNKRVLITGHTGFKGGWLSLWLHELGAKVFGYSLKPKLENEFYHKVYHDGFIGEEELSDIKDINKLSDCLLQFQPHVIFHLAAQSLVRTSYNEPLETFFTNAMGTVNLLEAVRRSSLQLVIVNVTTDKVYENKEWIWAYRENEALGGNDPYSASKACSEIITNSYMQSYFTDFLVKVSTARAGNVIGGGDMSTDRLIPDYLRAYSTNDDITIRNPRATRPWQHVLDPLHGYLQLAEKMALNNGSDFIGSWNFGPMSDAKSVMEVVNSLAKITGSENYKIDRSNNPHEAQSLMLDSVKARTELNWKPKLDLDMSLKMTFDWFNHSLNNNMKEFTKTQIKEYLKNE